MLHYDLLEYALGIQEPDIDHFPIFAAETAV